MTADPTTTLIAKLAMVMPSYMDDKQEDNDSPYVGVQFNRDGDSIIKLTAAENEVLQDAMRCREVGDGDVIHRHYRGRVVGGGT